MKQTIFSPDRIYRYSLWREWEGGEGFLNVCALNPSIADEKIDDPTIRRCIGYAKDWGFNAFCMTNIFAFRATDPNVMKSQPSPVGIQNDYWIAEIAKNANLVVAGWGKHGTYLNRQKEVIDLLTRAGVSITCLSKNKDGTPKHPLYLKKSLKPILM